MHSFNKKQKDEHEYIQDWPGREAEPQDRDSTLAQDWLM